jgi:Dyp-type peroxidase family
MANPTALEKHDIQAIVLSGFPDHPHASYLLLKVIDAANARRWLLKLATQVRHAGSRPDASEPSIVNVAFSAAGLRAMGMADDALATFAPEFQEGMAGQEHRSRILGDTGESAPETWVWGAPRQDPVHVLLMLYASTADELGKILEAQRAQYRDPPALEEVFVRDTVVLPERREHFGFADGIAQPRVLGSGAHTASGGFVQAGEFVLGYLNEYKQLPPSPSIAAAAASGESLPKVGGQDRRDLGRNGTYLVVRHLAQDVELFWQTMQAKSAELSGAADRKEAIRLAAKCVGRWPDGAPLARAPDTDDSRLDGDNTFGYRDDPGGFGCPVGAHIRRANPRDSLEPGPDESLAVVNRHRILRRGRSYGPALAAFEKDPAGRERGLFFICINASIRRQFEFVQQTWLDNVKFSGLYEDKDPLLGDQDPEKGGIFTIPSSPMRQQLTGMPRFVKVKGGAYFFLPGVNALKAIAGLRD